LMKKGFKFVFEKNVRQIFEMNIPGE